jgi:hypothetical protein
MLCCAVVSWGAGGRVIYRREGGHEERVGGNRWPRTLVSLDTGGSDLTLPTCLRYAAEAEMYRSLSPVSTPAQWVTYCLSLVP